MRTIVIGSTAEDKTVWWKVDFGGVYNIYSINIQFKNYEGYGMHQYDVQMCTEISDTIRILLLSEIIDITIFVLNTTTRIFFFAQRVMFYNIYSCSILISTNSLIVLAKIAITLVSLYIVQTLRNVQLQKPYTELKY